MIIFYTIWFIGTASMLTYAYIKGKKALEMYPPLQEVKVLFKENRVSGYSTKSWKIKIGGAQNALQVIVTANELWLKPPYILLAATKTDLNHRFSWKQVKDIQTKKRSQIIITYQSADQQLIDIHLKLKNVNRFLEAVEESKRSLL